MAGEVALIDEADFDGDPCGRTSLRRQLSGARDAELNQIGVRRRAEMTSEGPDNAIAAAAVFASRSRSEMRRLKFE